MSTKEERSAIGQIETADCRYTAYTLKNFKTLPQINRLTKEQIADIEVVSQVFPFKTNNYVVNNLIDWENIPHDPIFILNFPQKGMLKPHHYKKIADLMNNGADAGTIAKEAMAIRWELNPHPAGQQQNVPVCNGVRLKGSQHKYRETILFFPSQGQTCHAYCTFCFRWPQFVGMSEIKFAMHEVDLLVEYIRQHPEITDLLFTGGDPLIMKTSALARYIRPILEADLGHLRTIRFGTKALAYWPCRFITDDDADALLALFSEIVAAGKHLAFMAHFNHPVELEPPIVHKAIAKIKAAGAQIRTQSPVLGHINDRPEIWAAMLQRQVELGCVPYYMFIARNTGAHHYFGVPLERAWRIFRKAYRSVSGLARTIRGPSMSAWPGKIQVLGVSEVHGEKIFVLRMLQGRNPSWVNRPFFAQYNKNAEWITDLKPAFGEEQFFFETHPPKHADNANLI